MKKKKKNGDFEEGKGIFHNGIFYFLVKSTEPWWDDIDGIEKRGEYDTGNEYSFFLIQNLNKTAIYNNIQKENVWKLLNVVIPYINKWQWPAYESLKIFWENNKVEQKDEYGYHIIVFKRPKSFKF